ncbi:MAG: pyruvate dehydrogenase (acetyl-transferring) E1 component subunit alpha [Aminobacterium sp.]|jgi:pyruvate dehydrogenase E1 component alpha subunit|nr:MULTISPECIES: pyruvate dehydrogenase (acetyl-transferring) E1 component subunit alpha [unclassified Aminobacterium]MDD2205984.1 pyruvate dehydrogenase (acetyl-transferring) E1 component subunit alpha [Aminobacterium sp.]MDD3426143.1 pyruvate dehydrogenase (acetyl-transferring) E1 component subunit alpha [Aminobacterium sp.]MDD3707161.1 pyruvate dehydrogenase (acetyl-transferring) E1 component subunit alpha [Aminobacterium sp.]MDD4227859.1 pyruvate dehydrogenase (acetyl-transferring) E1 compo
MCAKAVRREPTIPIGDFDKETLHFFFETMVKIRHFEEKVEEFFFAGEIPGFVHLYIGEEAVATGVMANLRKTDYIQSTHRGHGHTIAKGADLNRMMAEIFGKKTGYCKGKGGSMHIADFSVGMLGANGIVGGGFTLATGAALAQKMQKTDGVSVVFFGDGASNRGTFHEAANMAAVWKLPVLFVCENNQWASTTPYRTTTSVEDIADRAQGYDMPGIIVDGNDVFAVYEAAKELIERARKGEGPALLEAKTYRIKGHFVGDPEKYRTKEEVQKVFDETDPIPCFKGKAIKAGVMSEEDFISLEEAVKQAIEEAVDFARKSPEPDASELFEDLYV